MGGTRIHTTHPRKHNVAMPNRELRKKKQQPEQPRQTLSRNPQR